MKTPSFPFPILQSETCTNEECNKRQQISTSGARRRWAVMVLRLCSLAVVAGWVGAGISSLTLLAQQQYPFRQTIEQLEIQDAKLEIARLRNALELQNIVITDQGKDISRMYGIGIGLGSILLVLQVAQILTARPPGK